MSSDTAHPFDQKVVKKKVHPNPLTRSVDVGAPVRPLAEIRSGQGNGRVIVPLAVAAALALGIAGCSTKAPIEREGSRERRTRTASTATPPETAGGAFVDVIKRFIDPDPEPARLAGEIAPVPVGSSKVTPVTPAPVNTFITPMRTPPRLAGDVEGPSPPVPPTAASPTNTVASPPPPPPTSITPNPGHPKLGGKPVANPPGGPTI